MSSLFNQKAIPNYLYWMPFYSQHQTINNNYLYFEGNEKNNINNNIYDEKNKIENKKFILPNIQSPIPISEKKIFSESEKDDINSKKTEKNITTKFFTDYGGYGYKCSCSKTQCNRYYCECYRSGAIGTIANAIVQAFIASIAIAKTVTISLQKIMYQIGTQHYLQIKQRLKR